MVVEFKLMGCWSQRMDYIYLNMYLRVKMSPPLPPLTMKENGLVPEKKLNPLNPELLYLDFQLAHPWLPGEKSSRSGKWRFE